MQSSTPYLNLFEPQKNINKSWFLYVISWSVALLHTNNNWRQSLLSTYNKIHLCKILRCYQALQINCNYMATKFIQTLNIISVMNQTYDFKCLYNTWIRNSFSLNSALNREKCGHILNEFPSRFRLTVDLLAQFKTTCNESIRISNEDASCNIILHLVRNISIQRKRKHSWKICWKINTIYG